jgi:hypothetical protein
MLRPALILTALVASLAPAAAAQARPVDIGKTAGPAIERLAKQTSLPVLLPNIPIDLDIGPKTKVYGSASGDGKSWGVSLAGARHCGANACFLAAFSGEKGAKLGWKTNVTLATGVRAHFQPLSCGGSCSPPWIAWRLHGIRYEIQAKTVAGSKAEFVKYANSALEGGG